MIHPKISQSATMFGAKNTACRSGLAANISTRRFSYQQAAQSWTAGNSVEMDIGDSHKGAGSCYWTESFAVPRKGKERKKHKGVTASLSASMKADCHVLVPCSSCAFFTSFVLVHFTLK